MNAPNTPSRKIFGMICVCRAGKQNILPPTRLCLGDDAAFTAPGRPSRMYGHPLRGARHLHLRESAGEGRMFRPVGLDIGKIETKISETNEHTAIQGALVFLL